MNEEKLLEVFDDCKYYVYQFFNEDWGVPFYVGKGSGNRYKQLAQRSKHIQSIWDNYSCKSQILELGLTETEAYIKERQYKNKYKSEGKPIIDGESNVIRKLAQAEGIAAAKAKGKYLGRPKLIKPDNWNDVYSRWIKGEITGVEAMRILNLKKSSFYKLAKLEKEKAKVETE